MYSICFFLRQKPYLKPLEILSIDGTAIEDDFADTPMGEVPSRSHAVETAVFKDDSADICRVIESIQPKAIFRLRACHVLQDHVSHFGDKSPACVFPRLIVEVDAQHRLTALAHCHIANMDILYDSASG